MAKDTTKEEVAREKPGKLPMCAVCNKPVDFAEKIGGKVYVVCHNSREGRVAGSEVYFGG